MTHITLPGLIDPHVHLRDPGQTEKEDFFTGTSAALAGGFTTVGDMPNNKVPTTTLQRLDEKIASAREKTVCDIGFYFGTLGDNLDQFTEAAKKSLGLKIFLNHTTGDYLLNPEFLGKIFIEWPETSPILFHAENETFDLVLSVLKTNPRPVHLCHLSTAYELKRVIEAKEKGLTVTCGVTPHHLFLTRDDETKLGSLAQMKPPLQSREDVEFLWNHLDAIDVIESDHAPHLLSEKQSGKPYYGVPNLETTLPLLLTAVHEEKLTIDEVIRLCHTNPSKIFSVVVNDDTKTIVDADEEWVVENETLFTKCKWSPYAGWKMKGRVQQVFLRGEKVFEDGKVLVSPGSGKILP